MNCVKKLQLKDIIRRSLEEDIGRNDYTTSLTIPRDKSVKAVLLAKESCLVCGMAVAEAVFKARDKKIKFKPLVRDGQFAGKGKVLARIQGRASSILTAERVALNFLALLSAVATKVRTYARAVQPYKTKIMDTRKTIPGLRQLEKYAVRVGGGYNHRMRLDEMVLIKDNHLVALCALRRGLCVQEIIENIRRKNPKLKVEIEVKNLKEFSAALKAKPDIIMLDNMNIPSMRMAVAMKRRTQDAGRRTLIEASGGVTLKNIKQVAACGVDMISIGELTDSIRAVDLSLEFLSR